VAGRMPAAAPSLVVPPVESAAERRAARTARDAVGVHAVVPLVERIAQLGGAEQAGGARAAGRVCERSVLRRQVAITRVRVGVHHGHRMDVQTRRGS